MYFFYLIKYNLDVFNKEILYHLIYVTHNEKSLWSWSSCNVSFNK